MKQDLIKFRMFDIGDRVMIIPKSRFYKGEKDEPNPKDVGGKIISIEDVWYKVLWDNGRKNGYEFYDLQYEGDEKAYTVDANKIYLAKEPKDVDDVFNILFSGLSGRRSEDTYYKDVESGALVKQCSAGRMRSFDDIYLICDTYFPDVDIRHVFRRLMLWRVTLAQVEEGIIDKQLSNCSTMERIRYTNSTSMLRNLWRGIDCAKYGSTYTWRDLFNMIYINSEQQLKEWYIENLTKEKNDKIVQMHQKVS